MPSGRPQMPAMPVRKMSDPFGTPSSPASPASSSERKVDYSTGISNRDFEEETIAIGKSEFEVVKPLAALLTKDDEEPVAKSASFDSPRPSMSSSIASDFATPRRPLPPPHSVTAPYPPSSASATPYMTASHARSVASLSHFSPPTPASVEDGGRAALDDYRAKEAKWLQVMSTMTVAQARKSKKVKALAQSGIPSSVRGKAWAFLADAQAELAPGLYQVRQYPRSRLLPKIDTTTCSPSRNRPSRFLRLSKRTCRRCSTFRSSAKARQVAKTSCRFCECVASFLSHLTLELTAARAGLPPLRPTTRLLSRSCQRRRAPPLADAGRDGFWHPHLARQELLVPASLPNRRRAASAGRARVRLSLRGGRTQSCEATGEQCSSGFSEGTRLTASHPRTSSASPLATTSPSGFQPSSSPSCRTPRSSA